MDSEMLRAWGVRIGGVTAVLIAALVMSCVLQPDVSRWLFNPVKGGGVGGIVVLGAAAFAVAMVSFQILGPALARAAGRRSEIMLIALTVVAIIVVGVDVSLWLAR